MGKKKLDNLFQEKFTDFSRVPDENVWERIEVSLDKKKKNRKVIPLWRKLGGVAAVLALLIYVINPFGSTPDTDPVITDIEKTDDKDHERVTDEADFHEILQKDDPEIVNTTKKEEKDTSGKSIAVKEKNHSATFRTKSTKSSIVRTQEDRENIRIKNRSVAQEIQLTDTDVKKQSKDDTEKTTLRQPEVIHTDKGIADSGLGKEKKETQVAADNLDGNYLDKENTVQDNLNESKQEGIAHSEEEIENSVEDPKKKSILAEIKAQEEKEAELAENLGGKWSIGPNIAPVYFNSLGKGSPIHPNFVPNSKSGDINLSYGLSVAYEISKKLSIRSGVNKVNYGYNTNEVEFTSTFGISDDEQIANIDYAPPSVNVLVESKIGNDAGKDAFSELSGQSNTRNGVLAQQFGYLEVPVELEYTLIDRRFGVNLVGGVSSMFLTDNSVAVTSGELTTEIGEANNLNSVNFSTNIGFGLDYKFSSKVQLNIAPVFKYQLHTFSNTSGTFQPFSIGIYSGLNFKF